MRNNIILAAIILSLFLVGLFKSDFYSDDAIPIDANSSNLLQAKHRKPDSSNSPKNNPPKKTKAVVNKNTSSNKTKTPLPLPKIAKPLEPPKITTKDSKHRTMAEINPPMREKNTNHSTASRVLRHFEKGYQQENSYFGAVRRQMEEKQKKIIVIEKDGFPREEIQDPLLIEPFDDGLGEPDIYEPDIYDPYYYDTLE